jgi:hypothetical protein
MKAKRTLILLISIGAGVFGLISEACDNKTISTGSSACDDTKTTCESTTPSGTPAQCANEFFVAMFPTDCNTVSTDTYCNAPLRNCSITCRCKPDIAHPDWPCLFDSYSGNQWGQKKKNEPNICPKS